MLTLIVANDAFAAKRDFKGLFGSYRREKFTENEARSSDFGVDLLLSTLLPVTPIVRSTEDRAVGGTPMHYATFFNFETAFFYTINYHFETFLNLGYYSYDTRKENTQRTDPALPLFHQFEMEVIPAIGGVKYRLSMDDIVPYVGAGVGAAYVRRKGFYDYNNVTFNEQFMTVLAAQLMVGLEFFFSPRAGIRLEAAGYFMKLTGFRFDTGGTPGLFPIIEYQPNPWSVRYASGIFFLF